METEKSTWKDIVADALRELGGQAHLSQINEHLKTHPKTKTNPTWQATIRRVVRQYTIFQPVPPENSGIYKLTHIAPPFPEPQDLNTADTDINHDIAQGMLVALGNIYGYETFVPAHDQTARIFQGKPLKESITVKDCTDIFKGPNLAKIREIDVLWFTEDDYGLFPSYAFEVEHTTRIKNGLDRLLKIPSRFATRLFIIAPGQSEQVLFEQLVNQTPFREHQNRFVFRRYEQLQEIYELALRHESQRQNFGVVERYRKT
ncbi:MAG: hypothetical protein WHX52_15665 [Anaerolineae bacterium]